MGCHLFTRLSKPKIQTVKVCQDLYGLEDEWVMNIQIRSTALLVSFLLVLGSISNTQAVRARPVAPIIQSVGQTIAHTSDVPHPILGDLNVRRAIAYCTDREALVASVYPSLDVTQTQALLRDSFIPTNHWAYNDLTMKYPYSPTLGQQLLDTAGWTLGVGDTYRKNAAGRELALKFTTTTAAFRQTWATVLETQMQACGIRMMRLHVPASWWFGSTTGLARRDFELGAFAWVGQADPGGVTLYACDQIPRPENGWEGQNYICRLYRHQAGE